MNPFRCLPDELLMGLGAFLSEEYTTKQTPYRITGCWRSFLISDRSHYEIKKRLHYLSLNSSASMRFVKEEQFRLQVNSHLRNPSLQLEIQIPLSELVSQFHLSSSVSSSLPSSYLEIADTILNLSFLSQQIHSLTFISTSFSSPFFLAVSGVHRLEVGMSEFSEFRLHNVQRIVFISTNQTDVQTTLNAEWISGDDTKDLRISKVSEVLNPEALARRCPNLEGVTIRHSSISDLSAFHHVKSVHLWHCPHVSDLSCLPSKLEKLLLLKCPLVKDVTSFDSLEFFVLSDCPNVRLLQSVLLNSYEGNDFEKLAYVKKLNCQCLSLQNHHLEYLKDVTSLSLANCTMISDISALANVETLNIANCYKIRELPSFTRIRSLDLSCRQRNPSQIERGLEIKSLRALRLGYVANMDYFNRFLQSIPFNLKLWFGETNVNWSQIPRLRNLRLESLDRHFESQLLSLPSLTACKVSFCSFQSLQFLKRLSHLEISFMHSLTSIDLQSSAAILYVCQIAHCPTLTRIKLARKVLQLRIKECKALDVVEHVFPFNEVEGVLKEVRFISL